MERNLPPPDRHALPTNTAKPHGGSAPTPPPHTEFKPGDAEFLSRFAAHFHETLEISSIDALKAMPSTHGGATTGIAASSAPTAGSTAATPSANKPPRATSAAEKGSPARGSNAGRMFGKYELLQEIARGGMGIVYKARQTSLNRIVAIKMILGDRVAEPTEIRRLYTEAETAAKLSHANIVAIHEVGEHEGRHYFSMDYVEGRCLAELTRGGPMPVSWGARCVRKLASAIHYAHEQGVLHRDLKPSNILIDSTGEPHITDFGVAKQLDKTSNASTLGHVIGTPSYMPPEQASGRKDLTGPHSDVYSLGAILYELLTGRPPFQAASTIDIFLLVQKAEPLPPMLLNPRVPRDLQTICLKCLAKDPKKRYATAKKLAEDLERFIHGEAILARPTPWWEKAWKWARRKPAVAALAAFSCLAVLCLSTLGVWYHTQLDDSHRELLAAHALAQQERQAAEEQKANALREQAEAQRQRQIAESQRQLALDRELTARRHLYAMHMLQVQQAWETGDMGRVIELLELQRPQVGQTDLRGFEWYYYWKLCHGEIATLRGHRRSVTGLAYAPDGRTLVTGSSDGTVQLWNTQTNQPLKTLLGQPGGVECIAVTTDGKWFAAGGADGTVILWDARTAQVAGSIDAHTGAVRCLAFSENGRRLVTGGDDQSVRVWDVERRQRIQEWHGHQDRVCVAKFAPAGEYVVSSCGGGTIKLWRMGVEREVVTLVGHEGAVTALDFAHDTSTLVSGSVDGTIRLWDLHKGIPRLTIKVRRGPITSIAVSKNGQTLAVGTARQVLTLLDTATWKEISALYGHVGPVTDVAFSPAGSTIASASHDGTVKIWDQSPQKASAKYDDHHGEATSVVFSPDGALFATSGGDAYAPDAENVVVIRESASGNLVKTLQVFDGRAESLAFSPDGHWLAAAVRADSQDCGSIMLWRTRTWELGPELPESNADWNSLTFSPDGRQLVAGGTRNAIARWDVDSWRALEPWTGHTGEITGVAFAPTGSRFASASLDGTVRIWDVATGRCERVCPGHLTYSPVAFSSDGRWLATGEDDPLADAYRRVNTPLEPVVLVPSSTIGQVEMVDSATGREAFVLKGHSRTVHCLAFSPDGGRLATGGRDGQVKIWDTATGHHLTALPLGDTIVFQLAFSPDGRTLATAGSDGSIRLWKAANHVARVGEPSPIDRLAIRVRR